MSKEKFDHKNVEQKWQKKWEETDIYRSTEDSSKKKAYVLDMFPYPSGDGLHVGHPKGYIATDIYSRYMRMRGHSVLHPMGWDAFGLPAENFAIKNKVHPRTAVDRNIAHFKEQLSHIGFDYDWSREINTTDPFYYKWTQWIFLKMFEQGLAYQSNEPINWCPSCMTGLANEDLDGNLCERCGTQVEKKKLPQWVLKITDYADRMLSDLNSLNWPEHIKEAQKNWIGRSEGAEIQFPISNSQFSVKVFTTRPETIFGATYLVLAPEHELVSSLASAISNKKELDEYVQASARKTEIERDADGKEKTGVKLLGVSAINPATKEEIPIFVADFVLSSYGTGAIMSVPAHDERDFDFAKKFDLPIVNVIKGNEIDTPCMGVGKLINSGDFNGHESEEAKWNITKHVGGKKAVQYRLRDWVFSRQRYWGEPIPIIHCEMCGAVPVPLEDLPVLLPEVESYEPTGTGESPLASISEWVNTKCPKCGGQAKRETNTMPQWAGSSWYHLRYMDPHNNEQLVSNKNEKYWGSVDVYVGGDHAVRHLIYARFWHKFLYDIGVVDTSEPFARLEFLGFILAEDGRKMSKRLGNIINPDDVIAENGADAFRIYEMFMGPFENTTAWNTASINGTTRFVERIWQLQECVNNASNGELDVLLQETIQKVGNDIEVFKFNTAVSQMMIFLNAVDEKKNIGIEQWKSFLRVLAPFAPHLTEELWEKLGETSSIHLSSWPVYDDKILGANEKEIIVQIAGRKRGSIKMPGGATEQDVKTKALEIPAIKNTLDGKKPKRIVFVPDKIINFVV